MCVTVDKINKNCGWGKKSIADWKTGKTTEGKKVGRLAVWLAMGLAGWLAAGLVGGLGGYVAGARWLAGWLAGWLPGCLLAWLPGRPAGWLVAGWLSENMTSI